MTDFGSLGVDVGNIRPLHVTRGGSQTSPVRSRARGKVSTRWPENVAPGQQDRAVRAVTNLLPLVSRTVGLEDTKADSHGFSSSSGGGTRTPDTRIMIPLL
jgi:hypothetical protein